MGISAAFPMEGMPQRMSLPHIPHLPHPGPVGAIGGMSSPLPIPQQFLSSPAAQVAPLQRMVPPPIGSSSRAPGAPLAPIGQPSPTMSHPNGGFAGSLASLNLDSQVIPSSSRVSEHRPSPIGPVAPIAPIGSGTQKRHSVADDGGRVTSIGVGRPNGKDEEDGPSTGPHSRTPSLRSYSPPPQVLGSKALADDDEIVPSSSRGTSTFSQNVWDPSPSALPQPQFTRGSIIRDRTRMVCQTLRDRPGSSANDFISVQDVFPLFLQMFPDSAAQGVTIAEICQSTQIEGTPENGGGVFDLQQADGKVLLRFRPNAFPDVNLSRRSMPSPSQLPAVGSPPVPVGHRQSGGFLRW
ncbi:hypothetical protein BT69DRAFT_50728 [Atractiella rhizophila]|nr:hypothetical protein BT69DRAFT_50728 [Atractiella rhizophila]